MLNHKSSLVITMLFDVHMSNVCVENNIYHSIYLQIIEKF